MTEQPVRRRSPWWVRQLSSRQVHGLTLRLEAERRASDTSDGQEWLFDACLSELAYRRRRTVVADWCTCDLCMRLVDLDPPKGRRRRKVDLQD